MPEINVVRDLSLEIFRRVRADWRFATEVTADVFRRATDLTDAERVEIVEASRDLIRHAQRIFSLIAVGATRRPEGLAEELACWTVHLLLKKKIDAAGAERLFPALDWREIATSIAAREKTADPAARLIDIHSMPAWIATRLVREYGDRAEAVAAALNAHPPRTLRTNTLKTTRESLQKALADEGIETAPTVHAKDGLIARARANVFRTRAFLDGLFEVQDEASQLGAELVMPPPRGFVVDACAGAGGKALAIAAALANKGSILALDIAQRKIEELRRRARRAGAHQIQAAVIPANEWPEAIRERIRRADRIFVDAPCSGTGSWRRNPEAKWQMTEAAVTALRETQFMLANRAADHLQSGARLVYATCSLLREENEATVERLLAERSDLSPVTVKELIGEKRAREITDPTGTFLKLDPDRHGTDGFFLAVFRKR